MPRHLERPPRTNNARLDRWLEKVHEAYQSLRPVPSLNTQTTRTAIGTSIKAKPGGGEAAPPGMIFRGEWDGTVSYKEQDVVVIRGGVAAGTYVCVRDAPATTPMPTYPATGDFWVNLSPGNTLGAWQ